MTRKEFEINLDDIIQRAATVKRLDKLEEELYFFARLVNTNYELKVSLESIATHTSQKKEIVRDIMPSETSDLFFEILDTLIEAERFDHLYQVASSLSQKVADRENMVLGEVITAVPVPEKFVKTIQLKLAVLSGSQIKLKNFVDSNLVGGLVVKLKGGRIIDTSIKKKLEEMKYFLKGDA